MKKMQLTKQQKQQLEELNKKCPACYGATRDIYYGRDCQICECTGKNSIEIEKEWVECNKCKNDKIIQPAPHCDNCFGKNKIPKYKVGDEIYYDLFSGIIDPKYYEDIKELDDIFKLKIISETEDKWRVCLV